MQYQHYSILETGGVNVPGEQLLINCLMASRKYDTMQQTHILLPNHKFS